jgi:hypothetical protein
MPLPIAAASSPSSDALARLLPSKSDIATTTSSPVKPNVASK